MRIFSVSSVVQCLSRAGQHAGAHIFDHGAGEFAGLHFGGAGHQALEVVGHFLLLDGALHALLDQVGGFVPAEMAEHHDAGQDDGAGIDNVLVGVLGRGAEGGLEDGVAIADVGAGGDSEAAHLGRAGVGDVVAVQIRAGQHGILFRPSHHLLEDGVGDAVVDHDFFLPLAVAMRRINRVEHLLHFFFDCLAEGGRSKLHPRFDRFGILRDRQARIVVFVTDNPALAFGDDLVAEFFGGDFVSPLAECTLSKLLDVALVHQRDAFEAVRDRVLDGHADQALGSGDGNRLDADAGIEADLLLAAFQHVFVEELDQAGAVGSSLLPLDTGVDVFGVLAEDDDVHALGVLHRRRHALVILHGANAAVKVENLPQGDVERADAAAHGSGQRAFDGDAKLANGVDGVIGEPGVEFGFGFLSGEDLIPGDSALAFVGFLDRGIEDAQGGLPNVAAGAIAFNERNDRIVGNVILSVGITDFLSIRWYRYTVIRASHAQPPLVEFRAAIYKTDHYKECFGAGADYCCSVQGCFQNSPLPPVEPVP